MYIALMTGIGPGISHTPIVSSILLIMAVVLALSVKDILFPFRLLTNVESGYVLYLQNLAASGMYPKRPWLAYVLQCRVFYGALGIVGYFLADRFLAT